MSVLLSATLVGCIVSPEEIDPNELLNIIESDNALITQSQMAVDGPLSLGDIMARAVLTNLDQKVSNLEEALALGAFELSQYDMLPTAAISSTYYDRNNENASRSISVLTRQETLEASTSQETEHLVSDLRVSWNLLDFGVSYFQAKQEADRYLITGNNRKKAFIDLMQQARGAYWRALAAQRLKEPVQMVLDEAFVAYEEVSQGIEERIYPSMLQAMQLKKELFVLMGDLEVLESELQQSLILLANFINVPSDTDIVLEEPESLPELPTLDIDSTQLELTALMNSTEVTIEAYNARIELAETRKALLRLLPGIEIGDSVNRDTNEFLFNNDWNEASVRVSWNLMSLATTRQTLRSSKLRSELQVQRRLAANMAVVTRLNLAMHQYNNQLSQVKRARELQQIDSDIADLTANAVSSDSDGQVNLVRTQAEAITAELSYLLAYAQVQEAYGTVLVSLGLNPLPLNYNEQTVDQLSEALELSNSRWYEGDLQLQALN
ncbi:MAG: TolC family protein [Pseudohongiellaceae bacterium]